MISSNEKLQLRQLIQMPQWKAFEGLANELISQLESNSPVRDNEWDTIRSLLTKEGQIEVIKRLTQEVYAKAQ